VTRMSALVRVVCCQVQVSASGWSLVQRSPTECGVSNWVWSWILENEEALVHLGPLRHGKKQSMGFYSVQHVTSVGHIRNTFIILVAQLTVREWMTVPHVYLSITVTHVWNQLTIRIEYSWFWAHVNISSFCIIKRRQFFWLAESPSASLENIYSMQSVPQHDCE
jgi:hypothetical protein